MGFRSLINSQIHLSRWVDSYLPASVCIDGNRHFLDQIVSSHLVPGLVLIDVGGGKQPLLDVKRKNDNQLRVIGIDISQSELDHAPIGAYDETISADISKYQGEITGDIIVCQSLLEHVRDVPSAIKVLARMVKPEGKLLVFAPSRNALFARINLLLPQRMKEKLLFSIYPHTRRAQGFPSYYDNCTPAEIERLALENGLVVVENHHYYMSAYFTFFLPFHIGWRIYSCIGRALFGRQAAESFSFVFRRNVTVPKDYAHHDSSQEASVPMTII